MLYNLFYFSTLYCSVESQQVNENFGHNMYRYNLSNVYCLCFQKYLNENKYGVVTHEDLFDLLTQVTLEFLFVVSQTLRPLHMDWFEQAQLPECIMALHIQRHNALRVIALSRISTSKSVLVPVDRTLHDLPSIGNFKNTYNTEDLCNLLFPIPTNFPQLDA